jgi:hypothetical protein
MTKRPTFEGFRSPDGTRKECIALYLQHAAEAQEAIDSGTFKSEDFCYKSPSEAVESWRNLIAQMEGEGGQAWDRVCVILQAAMVDPVICKSQSAVEFLQIMHSVANTTCGTEDVDGVMQVFRPVFASQRAFDNSAISKPPSSARRWVRDEWFDRTDKGQSKAAFARQYSALVKQKYGISVTPDTIARDWLPKPEK